MICDVSYKGLIGSKPLRITFDKTDGLIKVYDGTRYLTSFGSENYDAIYNRIKYFICLQAASYILLSLFCKN